MLNLVVRIVTTGLYRFKLHECEECNKLFCSLAGFRNNGSAYWEDSHAVYWSFVPSNNDSANSEGSRAVY